MHIDASGVILPVNARDPDADLMETANRI